MINIFMQLYCNLNDLERDISEVIGLKLDQIVQSNNHEYNGQGLRSELPIADILISPNEYFDESKNNRDWSEWQKQGLWQYHCDSCIGIINNQQLEFTTHIHYITDDLHDIKTQCEVLYTSRPITNFYGVAMLNHPVGYFLKNLKYDRNDLRTNITGHYRGTYMVGKQYLLDLLHNCDEWWMESQSQRIDRWKPDVIWRDDIQYNLDRPTIENLWPNVEWPWGVKNLLGILHKSSAINDQNVQRHHQKGKLDNNDPFNVWLERHLRLEESAWEFLLDSEVWNAFLERYEDDFNLGKFPKTIPTGSWLDYWLPRGANEHLVDYNER